MRPPADVAQLDLWCRRGRHQLGESGRIGGPGATGAANEQRRQRRCGEGDHTVEGFQHSRRARRTTASGARPRLASATRPFVNLFALQPALRLTSVKSRRDAASDN